MATVKIILREDRCKVKNGKAPLYLRITKNRKSKYISLGASVLPKNWNTILMKVSKGEKNYQILNAYLATKIAEAEASALNSGMSNKNITTKELRDEIIGKRPELFFEYTDAQLELMKKSRGLGTLRAYNSQINMLKEYVGDKPLYFDDINIDFIKKYENYLYNVKGNNANTVKAKFKAIKLFFNQAVIEDHVDANLYPFNKYRFKSAPSKRTYLNDEQFNKLLEYKVKKGIKKEVFYDMYIFSAYSGGLRFSDLLDLQWKHYNKNEQRLIKVIRKTGRTHQFKLPKRALAILEKYNSKEVKKSDYVFPLLLNGYDYDANPEQLFNEKSSRNAQGNKLLKEIGEVLEFPFNLTFHTSRHTFATRALNKGMRIEHVSKLLDHNDIKITQIYAKIINEELDKAMSIMDD